MELDSFIKIYDSPGYLLRRSGQFVTFVFDAEMGGMGVTASQMTALLAIHVQPGMQQRELAAALHWDEATIGGMIRRLESQGLLERHSSPRSRRGREIYLTEAGKELYERILPHVIRVQKNLLKALELDERQQLLSLLSKMLNITNSYHKEKPARKRRSPAGIANGQDIAR